MVGRWMVQEPFGQVLMMLNDQDTRNGAAALVCGHLGWATLGFFKDVHVILGEPFGGQRTRCKGGLQMIWLLGTFSMSLIKWLSHLGLHNSHGQHLSMEDAASQLATQRIQ